jgi:hypothetical protein
MWLGDIAIGDDTAGDATPAPASDNSFMSLAANLVDIIHPYKQGVPVNIAISPQTQTFLLAGFVGVAGLLVFNLMSRRK